MRRILVWAICAVTLVACGSGSSTPKATTTVPPPTTTTAAPTTTVEVRPSSGPVGTSFQLLATRFQAGETVVFEITFPDGKTFKGQPHKAAADGSVSASFRVTAGNPPGDYQVKASGDKGSQAGGQFVVTSGGSTSTTVAGHSSTTAAGHPSTTKKP